MRFPGESLDKLQLPFGPGNKKLMDKLPMKGDPLSVNEMFAPAEATPIVPAATPKSANPLKDEQDAAFRLRQRKARQATEASLAPLSTSLG